MARPVAALAPLARPVAFLPDSWRVPLLGWLWVLFNFSLVWLGITFGQLTLCSVAVGSVDGAVVAIIAVAKASEKFQAAATGLLGGMGVNKISGEANLIQASANGIHHAVDAFMDSFAGGTYSEELHAKVESALLLIVWTAVFVVMASLIGEWIRVANANRRVPERP